MSCRNYFENIFEIVKTTEFEDWFVKQPLKTRVIINARLQRIVKDGHFGTINTFDKIVELKWKSGLRIYIHRKGKTVLIILCGGNKNAQEKDIRKAKKLIKEFEIT